MHPSISLSLDPGLECGVPGGRDLYTFVTSAAGHMMRTLQKPRKNRPSKRQVNHRRFLHNMIQRKFADIEAANHRLASALYFKVDEKKPDATEPAPNPPQLNPAGENAPEISLDSKDCLTESRNAPTGSKTHREATSKPKSRKSKLKKTDPNVFDFASSGSAFTEAMDFFGNEYTANTLFSMDGQINGQTENSFLHFEQGVDSSPSFSPELSPLSLDSCDFSVQMFTDVPSSAQNNAVEMTETQWTDICDLFSKDLRGSANIETYLDGFCDAECSDECEQEDCFTEAWPCKVNSDQVLSANHLGHFDSLVTSGHEVDMTNFTLSNDCNVIQNELQFPVSCQSFQDPLCQAQRTRRSELNPIPFEGVAQSFSAPSQNVLRFSIPTPPIEGDWPFTDILTDNTASCN